MRESTAIDSEMGSKKRRPQCGQAFTEERLSSQFKFGQSREIAQVAPPVLPVSSSGIRRSALSILAYMLASSAASADGVELESLQRSNTGQVGSGLELLALDSSDAGAGAWAPGMPDALANVRLAQAESTPVKGDRGSTPRSAAAKSGKAASADVSDKTSEIISEVVVYGSASRIQREGFVAPTPTIVLTAEDLRMSGRTDIAAVLNDLPALRATFTSVSQNLVPSRAGTNSPDLRGLGPGKTLVLIDGHRPVPMDGGGAVDLNSIPMDLVERV